ncbi:putative amidohydrolase [Phaeomoniella chlamydospora]|uniref:Putative amidohydrolase n=1 Tax=Phaeomoniella chlamydospora TaxID=158046 RepID=A0A0G2EQH7_PHACM|nr:putative amidohydrolase [Phaeomoniella chlamydospora]
MDSCTSVMEDWEIISRPNRKRDDLCAGDSIATQENLVKYPHPSDVDDDFEATTSILADLLIPGKGKPSTNQVVVVEKGKITYVGDPNKVPSKYSRVAVKRVPVLMPGLWECHSHFIGSSPNKPITVENMAFLHPAEAGARNARALHDTLYAGFTSCVDLGGYAPELQTVIDEGSIIGPTLYGAGAMLSMTAGHGDVFELPLGTVQQRFSVRAPGTDAGFYPIIFADGVDECRKAVRVNLRRKARVIKVLTSGGVTSRDDNPMYRQFSDEELKVIVEEAGRMGLSCAAHAIGKAGIMAAIRAGFKVIEHNSFADDEVIDLMKKKGVMLVATMTPLQSIVDNKDSYPKEMYDKAMKVVTAHKEAYARAIKAGVRCAIGSDLFGGPGSVLGPGMNGREIGLAVAAGMSPLDAIEAATANGPLTLGPEQAPKSGQIMEGYDADLIALQSSPLEDIKVLQIPKNITHIWKAGILVKAPGLDSWDALASWSKSTVKG